VGETHGVGIGALTFAATLSLGEAEEVVPAAFFLVAAFFVGGAAVFASATAREGAFLLGGIFWGRCVGIANVTIVSKIETLRIQTFDGTDTYDRENERLLVRLVLTSLGAAFSRTLDLGIALTGIYCRLILNYVVPSCLVRLRGKV